MRTKQAPLAYALDTSVLFPWVLCDLLFSLASVGSYIGVWSEDIEAELHRNLVKRVGREASDRRILALHLASIFEFKRRSTYEALIPHMVVSTEDRPVAAMARSCGCAGIVTANVRDFERPKPEPIALEILSPDAFTLGLLEQNPELVELAFAAQLQRLQNPPISRPELLALMSKLVPNFAEALSLKSS